MLVITTGYPIPLLGIYQKWDFSPSRCWWVVMDGDWSHPGIFLPLFKSLEEILWRCSSQAWWKPAKWHQCSSSNTLDEFFEIIAKTRIPKQSVESITRSPDIAEWISCSRAGAMLEQLPNAVATWLSNAAQQTDVASIPYWKWVWCLSADYPWFECRVSPSGFRWMLFGRSKSFQIFKCS